MKYLTRSLRAISPVLAVLMMIAVAIAGALVTYAWVMGYIGFQTQKSGEAIQINSIANLGDDLVVYVQNVGETVVQLDEDSCLYVDGVLVGCGITNVSVSNDVATLGQGDTAKLTYFGGAVRPGDKVEVKVTTILGTSIENSAYPAGTTEAEPGSVRWTKTYEGGGAGRSVVTTSDGGYAIAGSISGDVGLVITDTYGNVEWSKTYGGTETEAAYSLVATSDRGYILAGFTGSFGAGWDDFWLIKTDSYGNMEWNKTYGGTGQEIAYSVVATYDGGYALAGYTSSFGNGQYDCWLVKTDADGNEEWNKTYGGPFYDHAYALIATADEGYAIAGYTDSSGTGKDDFWLVKTDADGNMEWNKTYQDTDTNRVQFLVATRDSGYAIAGFSGSVSEGVNSFNLRLVKTDASGNMEWNKKYSGPNGEGSDLFTGLSMVTTSDDGYAIAGSLCLGEALHYEGWLVKMDASGNVEWHQTYGETTQDRVYSLIKTSDEGYTMAGTSGGEVWLIKTY